MKLTITLSDGGYSADWTGSLELLALSRIDYGAILLACVNELAKRVAKNKAMGDAVRAVEG